MFLVTGASSGIGCACADALATRGHAVVAVGRAVTRLHALQERSRGCVTVVAADLSTSHGIEAVLDTVKAAGGVQGIVHAAGSSVPLASYADLGAPEVQLARHIAVHVEAPIALNNGLHELLVGGRVLYIDSYSADAPRVGWAAYSIVKAAARMAALAAERELDGVRVIRVLPGGVRTPLIDSVLASASGGDVVDTFRRLDREGGLVDADIIGRYVCSLLLDATDDELAARTSWSFGNADDRVRQPR